MRIYIVLVVLGLGLLLTGCPDKPEKADQAVTVEDPSAARVTADAELPEKKEEAAVPSDTQ